MTEPRRSSPPWRPFVTLNVAQSADGKLAPAGGGKVNFGGAEDRAQMEALRAEADGVLIGGGTLLAEDPPLLIRDPETAARREKAKGSPHPWNIVAASVLPDRLAEMKFFLRDDTRKLMFTTERTPSGLLAVARGRARVEVVPASASGRVDLAEALRRMPALGIDHLLLEGGGELIFSMLQAGLVDEMYLTICPFVFGGRGAPTPCGGDGFPLGQIRKLALKSHRAGARGEIFLRYDVLPEPPQIQASALFPNGVEVQ